MGPHRATAASPRAPRPDVPSWLPLVLGAVVGLLLCTGALAVGSLLAPHPPDPAPTARALCSALTSRDYAAAYSLLSSQQQATGTQAQFVASQRQLDILRGPTRRCVPVVTADANGVADVTLTIARGTSTPSTAQIRLILSGNSWRINTFDSSLVRTAFPAVQEGRYDA
jgi:hypothetical protein